MKITALIPSAGIGLRMGGETRKQYICLEEKPIAAHTLLKFQKCREIDQVILIVPEDDIDYCQKEIISPYGLTKVIKVIAGGKERQDSVYNGLKALDDDVDIVVVNDGVRPFVTHAMIRESIQEALKRGAAIVAVPAKDTIKSVSEEGVVEKTVDRRKLWLVQTPQTFQTKIIKSAYEKAMGEDFYGTDDASLVERMGGEVRIVQGSEFNIKITTPEDLILGEGIIKDIESISNG